MSFSDVFINNDILAAGMNARILRNEVIQNNIANADTPGFKKNIVSFEDSLASALDDAKFTGRLELDGVEPVIHSTGFSYRLDENNVDIEEEMVSLYQNSAKYDVLVESVRNNYARINAVLGK